MQIKAITVNAVNTTALQNDQRNDSLAQVNNNMFIPRYKVTISKEGKKLSSQQAEQSQRSAQDAAVRRNMLRRDEESEQNEKITDGYREQLKNIQREINSLNRSFKTEAVKETIEKEQEVLRDMREQRQTQLEENQRRAEEARAMAMQSSKYQEDIDGNNRKLWTLLKTLEEAEKAKEEREGVYAEDNSDSDTPETETSVSDKIQNSATQLAVASMRRDLYVDGKLEWLSGKGHQYVDFANRIASDILNESENIIAALDDENYSDDMRAELVDNLQEDAMRNYRKIEMYRGNGLHILQEARDYKIKRISDNPLAGMQETTDSMMISATDAVLGEARQNHLDKVSKELEDEVQRLIDKRNDVSRTQEEDEEEEKMENLKELTEKEDDEQAETLDELIQARQ